MKKIIIYTDGSCLKNPGGPGGWAFAYIENNNEWFMSGSEKNTTNNRMELFAVLEALNSSDNLDYIIYSDSKLTINCAKKEWKRKANIDLWDKYDLLSKNKKIEWNWVKSHSNNEYNNIVDSLAREEAKNIKNK